jgi:AcrR family transcriptional regulator
MTRWQPDARGRLEKVALALYEERGFEQTTVAEIAARAGLTERTFFRHFADKREVLFAGAGVLEQTLAAEVAEAPPSASPIDVIGVALVRLATMVQERGELARQRAHVIAANSELQERELAKLASLASALADAMRARGVDGAAATLAAEVGIAVFRTAFVRWVDEPDGPDLPALVRAGFSELEAIAGARRA